MSQGNHRAGDVFLENERGIIWLLRASEVPATKILHNHLTLQKAEITPNAPLFYKKKKIGHVEYKSYHNTDGFLVVCVNLDKKISVTNDCLYAIPNLEYSSIQCINCLTIFSFGQTPCDCVKSAPVLENLKVLIKSVTIYNGLHDDINTHDARPYLLKHFFGSIVNSISLQDEEF